jgi:SAM-dependent methyltransferase
MSATATPDRYQRSTTGCRLEPLAPAEVARWDELIAAYHGRELFHRRLWLEYLAASRGVQIRHWAIRVGDHTAGYLCGGLLRIGPFRILGSPLKSWGTNVMGPLVDDTVDQAALLRAIDTLAQTERVAMTELEHPWLSGATLQAAGFERVRDWTYLVTLTPGDSERMWRALESTCRNRIRKAERAGLTVEDTSDPAVADEFYDFYAEMMRRKRVAPPFPRRTARLLFTHLKKADCLFALRVKDAQGRLLAVGLFPHDERIMYFWSGGSLEDGHPLCPNDYLHWTAMQLASSRGLQIYNMSGHGRFKRKFGGTLTEVARWHKCHWRAARWARKGYKLWFRSRSVLAGRLTPSRPGSASAPHTTGPAGPVTRRRPPFRMSHIFAAPLHDFPIRDEILFEHLPFSRDMDVLEIGPGSGFTAFRVAPGVRSLTLVDIAAANIAQLRVTLRGIPNLAFVCADVCKPDLRGALDRTFDAIYALEVFELLPDPEACLQNLAALLRPGGRLLLQFPNYPPPLSPGMTHFSTRAELDRLLADAGFSSWTVSALKLRPYAGLLYTYLHERPIRAYRRRRRAVQDRPLIYDQSWAFQHGARLEPFKYALHFAWAVLAVTMRLGGSLFSQTSLGEDILNRNLLVSARR